MHEVNRAANLNDNLPHPSIVSCERVASFDSIRLQVASRAIVQNQEHLSAIRHEEVIVKGDDVRVGRKELVVMYLAYGLV